jgi:hypothetical protein
MYELKKILKVKQTAQFKVHGRIITTLLLFHKDKISRYNPL